MLHYVYNLIDPRDGDVFYVGKGVGRRVYWHQPAAFRGGHCNPKLQNKIRKIRSLGFQIPVEKIFEHEEEWPCHVIEVMAIAFYGRGNLCNLTDGGEGISGYQHSEQAKLKIRSAATGRRLSQEAKAKMIASKLGKPLSLEHKEKLSAALTGQKAYWFGKTLSAETKAKISLGHVGKALSKEHRAKLSALRLGRKRSEETRARISAARLGRPLSEESKAKIAAAKRGGKLSDEHKANISASLRCEKAYWFGKKLSPEHKAKMSLSRKRFLGTLLALMVMCCVNARAYLLVEDIPALTNNSINEIKNYAQYLQQTANSATSITNQITQIENQVIALQRFGNPQYYVNMLGLAPFMNTASVLASGIGQSLSAYRQASNGLGALAYTGNGLYSNLTGTLDRYGNAVRYQPDAFRKFAAVNDMVESYNTQQRTYNAQMASLQQQLTDAMQKLNAASTQMETEKYAAQVNAIHAQINALTQTTNLVGQRAAIGQLSNQNDAARIQEANRQQEIQERQEDLQNEAAGFSRLLGGSP